MAKTTSKNEFEGTCQACFHSQVITGSKQTLVLHGYQRPGDGMLRGDCLGHGHLPYELSCDLTKELLARAQRSLEAIKLRRDLLVADKVETLVIEVANPEHTSYRSTAPRTKLITIGRDYDGKDNYGRNFEYHRGAAVGRAESDIKSTECTVAFYGKMVADWKLAPEALRDHATVVREEKAAKASTKAERAFRADWKYAWKRVAETISSHKDATDRVANIFPGASPEIRARIQADFVAKYGQLPAFPSNAERAAARKKFQK